MGHGDVGCKDVPEGRELMMMMMNKKQQRKNFKFNSQNLTHISRIHDTNILWRSEGVQR